MLCHAMPLGFTSAMAMASSSLTVLLSFLFLAIAAAEPASGTAQHFLGVNYGRLGDDLPPPHIALELPRSAGTAAVRFYDANATFLSAAASSGLGFVPAVPNELIVSLAASQRAADAWVASTLLPFRRNRRLRYLFVGNEVLSDPTTKSRWSRLVPAITNLRRALRRYGLSRVKVSTTLGMDALVGQNVFPPSAGVFRPDIIDVAVRPLLAFLERTDSYLFFDAYTYFTWSANHTIVPLTYALLEPSPASGFQYHDPGTGLSYTNLLDHMLDAVVAAMTPCAARATAASSWRWPRPADPTPATSTSSAPTCGTRPRTTATWRGTWRPAPARRGGRGCACRCSCSRSSTRTSRAAPAQSGTGASSTPTAVRCTRST
ncbi:hypothetical protein VPH35_092518 [Triticum aestivum]